VVYDPDRVELIALGLKRRVANLPIAQYRAAVRLSSWQEDPNFHDCLKSLSPITVDFGLAWKRACGALYAPEEAVAKTAS
jgi:hypothetical protein